MRKSARYCKAPMRSIASPPKAANRSAVHPNISPGSSRRKTPCGAESSKRAAPKSTERDGRPLRVPELAPGGRATTAAQHCTAMLHATTPWHFEATKERKWCRDERTGTAVARRLSRTVGSSIKSRITYMLYRFIRGKGTYTRVNGRTGAEAPVHVHRDGDADRPGDAIRAVEHGDGYLPRDQYPRHQHHLELQRPARAGNGAAHRRADRTRPDHHGQRYRACRVDIARRRDRHQGLLPAHREYPDGNRTGGSVGADPGASVAAGHYTAAGDQ